MFQVIIKGYYEKVRFLLTYLNSWFRRDSSEVLEAWWYDTEQRTRHLRSKFQHNRRIATVPIWHTKNNKLDSNGQQMWTSVDNKGVIIPLLDCATPFQINKTTFKN